MSFEGEVNLKSSDCINKMMYLYFPSYFVPHPVSSSILAPQSLGGKKIEK